MGLAAPMIPVDSSNLSALGYEPASSMLTIEFKWLFGNERGSRPGARRGKALSEEATGRQRGVGGCWGGPPSHDIPP